MNTTKIHVYSYGHRQLKTGIAKRSKDSRIFVMEMCRDFSFAVAILNGFDNPPFLEIGKLRTRHRNHDIYPMVGYVVVL